jgi:hypothetical protein
LFLVGAWSELNVLSGPHIYSMMFFTLSALLLWLRLRGHPNRLHQVAWAYEFICILEEVFRMITFRKICFYTAVTALVTGLTVGLLDIWEVIYVEDLTYKVFMSSTLLLVAALLGLMVDRMFGDKSEPKA